jgi:C-terminal processing protease CtpA/Prc
LIMTQYGTFEGDVVVQWLTHSGDDRDMKLLQNFAFTAPDGKRWLAPEGSVVNGASIPSALWSVVGPPFVGDYRRATVIHDVACDEKTEPHDRVHLAFYFAMRADGVAWLKANTMYQAVKQFGPKWSVDTGAVSPTRSPSVAEITSFLDAVQQAAKEVGEGGDLEEVERRAEQILRSPTAPRLREAPKPKVAPSPQRSLSRLTPLQGPSPDGRPQTLPEVPLFAKAPKATRPQLAGTLDLRSFRDATQTLSKHEQLLLVEQAQILIEQNYVHLPLKEAMHAVEPRQRLRLLHRRIEQTPDDERGGSLRFHQELAAIFLSLRDLHTNYLLPDPIANKIAFVPFMVEDFFDEGEAEGVRRYLVTRLFDGFQEPPFAPGVEILRWNGIPIERAVELNGDRFAGSNLEARRARGIETLTVRPLIQSLPPDEDFVLVEYRTTTGRMHELRVPWFVFEPDRSGVSGLGDVTGDVATEQGIDVEQTLVRLARKVLFAPDVVAAEGRMARRKAPARGQGLVSMMPGVLEARSVTTDAGEIGYVRIWTFSVPNADVFVAEFIRLIEQLPQDGLIIDVRGNGGGLIPAGEQLLQVLTPREIAPTLFQLRNTPLNLRLAEQIGFLAPWRESMRQALETGAPYSAGFPITNRAAANAVGQRYHGPVVLITDALCYSTTDIFAAGFADHGIGPILGVDGNMGAGGANVWDHQLLRQLAPAGDSPYRPLPGNAGMRVSMRRTIRVGASAGTVLEDLGVVPDRIHRMTRNDLFEGNPDLIAAAADLIAGLPKRRLMIRLGQVGEAGQEVIADCLGMDRLDVLVNARPLGSLDISDGENGFVMPLSGNAIADFRGFSNGARVAVRRVQL